MRYPAHRKEVCKIPYLSGRVMSDVGARSNPGDGFFCKGTRVDVENVVSV